MDFDFREKSTDERAALTRDLIAQYRRLREEQQELRAQQHSCEIILQRARYLSSEERDETLARYEEVTRKLNAVTERCNEIERDEYVRAELERAVRAAIARGGSNGGTADDARVVLTRLADVNPEPVRWLWPARIPLGKVTVLDGDPGLGKSLLALDLAARVTTARALPDGTASDLAAPAGVVILSAEDDKSDTIRPRAEAAGADLTRIVTLDAVRDDDDESPRCVTLADLDALRDAIAAVDAKLVIVDPLMAYLPMRVDSHKDQDIRRVLAPLAALAADTGVAVLVIRHLNKNEGRAPLYRGGGSIGIAGAARSGLLVAPDPDDAEGERRVLVSTKSNLARAAGAITYEIKATLTPWGWIPHVAWGEACAHTAASLLNPIPPDGEVRGAVDEAKAFLREVLADGPRPAREVQREARDLGISAASLNRARRQLGVRSTKVGQPGHDGQGWVWSLPEGDQIGAEDDQNSELDHLRGSSEKNYRNYADVPEDDQNSELDHLRGDLDHLRGDFDHLRRANDEMTPERRSNNEWGDPGSQKSPTSFSPPEEFETWKEIRKLFWGEDL